MADQCDDGAKSAYALATSHHFHRHGGQRSPVVTGSSSAVFASMKSSMTETAVDQVRFQF
jgi:hypothetical protein